MGMRIRVLSGCLAIGATAVILTGTAAHATPLGETHPNVVVATSGGCPGQNDNQDTWNQGCQPSPCQTGVYDNNYNGNNGDNGNGYQSCKPTPKPTCTCEQTPPPTPPTIPPTTMSTTPAPQVTSQTPVPPSSSPPASPPQTGGGGSIGGGDGPLAAGGVAVALAAGLIGTFAYRRWRRTRLPAA